MILATLDTYGEYFTVDTDEWVADTLGDPDRDLTDSLGEFTSETGNDDTDTITAWLRTIDADDDDGPAWSGVYGDGEPWTVYTGNQESFLSGELSIILAYSRSRALVILADANAYGVHGSYAVYDVTGPGDEHLSILDYGRLTAICTAGHVSDSDTAGYDWHPSDGGDGGYWTARNVKLDAIVREYDECDADTRYVECPAPGCYHAVTVYTQ